jgi:cyclic pyranopterin phosphate synthase
MKIWRKTIALKFTPYRPCAFRGFGDISHVDDNHLPTMVDVSTKVPTVRTAHARTTILLPLAVDELFSGASMKAEAFSAKKGPIISTAVLAGVMAAKRTSDLIPLCHPVPLEDCKISIQHLPEKSALQIDCIAKTSSKTGVEMEALVGSSTAALCVYDMCKGVSHDICITETKLISKTGGKNDYQRLL